jgi:hypothetical protein
MSLHPCHPRIICVYKDTEMRIFFSLGLQHSQRTSMSDGDGARLPDGIRVETGAAVLNHFRGRMYNCL